MENSPTEPRSTGRLWAALVAFFAMSLTLLPYLIGWSFAGKRHFMWLGYNLDDSCVYLSWMRQAADGSFRALNLFTTDPQHGMLLNPLFLALGKFAGLTHLDLLTVYHASRLIFGFLLLMLVWEFLRENVKSVRACKLSLLCVAFAAGLGWLPGLWDLHAINAPIDTWQPEAITFLSLLLSPLFCFSMALQVGILFLLQKAERTRRVGYAVGAGLCGFALGITHTYDIITMCAVWGGYLLARLLLPLWKPEFPRLPAATWLYTLIAGILTFPAVAYFAWELHTETVFRKRAEVRTDAPSLLWVALGYGLLLILALLALFLQWRAATSSGKNAALPENDPPSRSSALPAPDTLVLLTVWPVMNLAASYLPVAFQRKMLQGEHFPIAILAGIGADWLLSRLPLLTPAWRFRFAATLLVFVLSLTNIQFMLREISNYENNRAQTGMHRTYLESGELDALHWIQTNTPPGTAVQPLPWIQFITAPTGKRYVRPDDIALAIFTPGLIDRPVYCGHFGETPDYGDKLIELIDVIEPTTSEARRMDLLRKMKVDYLIFSQKHRREEDTALVSMFLGGAPLPSYLVRVYQNDDADVYRVQLPPP